MNDLIEQQIIEEIRKLLTSKVNELLGDLQFAIPLQEKLNTPKAVLFATDEYREEMDVIGNFIKEKCVQDKDMTLAVKKLYKTYSDWCNENNEHPVSDSFFTLRLKEMGFQQGRTATEKYWVGIGLLE